MFDCKELSPDEEVLADKLDGIIINVKKNDIGNLEEIVISDDDVTIVLGLTDEDKSISEANMSKKKRTSIPQRRRRSCNTSTKSKKGFNLKKKLSKESDVLEVKSVVEDDKNGSPRKTTEQEVEKVKLPNDNVMVVRRGRKVIEPNIKSKTTLSPSLPGTTETVTSSFPSLIVEQSSEESTVKTRGRRAAVVSPSRPKPNESYSESDGKEEEPNAPAKFKKFKNMTDKMGSAVVLLQRLSPLIIAQSRVADQTGSSLNEEKGVPSSSKSSVPNKTVTSTLVGDKIPEAELILSLNELDDSKSNALSRRRRVVGSVSEVPEEKTTHVAEDTTLLVIASTSPDAAVTVLIEDHSATADVNQQITISTQVISSSTSEGKKEKSLATPGSRRGRPRKSITPVMTNKTALEEDDMSVVVDLKSKKTFPAKSKPKLHSESVDEPAEVFEEEEVTVTSSQPSANENEVSDKDIKFFGKKRSSIEDIPSTLKPLKRGRGRPPKGVSKSIIANDSLLFVDDVNAKSKKILTRRISNTPSVTPPKKMSLSGETTITPVVELRGDVENSENADVTSDIQNKDVKSGVRRGRGRPPKKPATSPETTIEKHPVIIVATRSTRKIASFISPETRMKYCNVLLKRDPVVEAMCIAMKNIEEEKSRKNVANAKSELPAIDATRVTRAKQKLASKSEPDQKISPLFPHLKRSRQI